MIFSQIKRGIVTFFSNQVFIVRKGWNKTCYERMALQLVTLKSQRQYLLSPIKNSSLYLHKTNSVYFPSISRLTMAVAVSVPGGSWEERIPPNVLRRKRDSTWRGGFSLGVDLGLSRTGLAISKGFSIRPLTVSTHTFYCDFFDIYG